MTNPAAVRSRSLRSCASCSLGSAPPPLNPQCGNAEWRSNVSGLRSEVIGRLHSLLEAMADLRRECIEHTHPPKAV